jgi:hypothetical protein
MAFDSAKFAKAYQAGAGPALFQKLAREHGIHFNDALGEMKWLPPGVHKGSTLAKNWDMALDVQSELATVASSGIPAYLATYFDPSLIPVLVSPMMAAVIAGERGIGDWLTEVAQFLVGEAVGETSAYGDYSMNGASNVNTNFPTRQNFLFQSFLQYGQREAGRMGLAKINWASEQQSANLMTLMKALNYMYFYGVPGLDNYGLINDPSLFASITPTYSWLTSSSATANTIYADIVRLFVQLQAQSNGVVANDEPMVLALSPINATTLKSVTQYNTNSVEVLIKENFPNLRIVRAVQYSTSSGQLVQLIAENVEGHRTLECAFSSKLMAHQMVVESSSWKQKRNSGGYGTIWYRPFLAASMLG